MGADDIISCKQNVQIRLDQILKKNARHLSVLPVRNPDNAGKNRRDLNRREHRSFFQRLIPGDLVRDLLPVFLKVLHEGHSDRILLSFPLASGDQCADVQGLVPDQRKWSGGVHGGRRQNRIDRLLEVILQVFLLGFIQNLRVCNQIIAFIAKSRNQGSGQRGILAVDQFMALLLHLQKLFFRRQSGKIRLAHLCVNHIHQGRNPDHKELIQVGRRDGQEFHPLKKRICFIPRLVQNPVIEVQPAQFTVRVPGRVKESVIFQCTLIPLLLCSLLLFRGLCLFRRLCLFRGLLFLRRLPLFRGFRLLCSLSLFRGLLFLRGLRLLCSLSLFRSHLIGHTLRHNHSSHLPDPGGLFSVFSSDDISSAGLIPVSLPPASILLFFRRPYNCFLF